MKKHAKPSILIILVGCIAFLLAALEPSHASETDKKIVGWLEHVTLLPTNLILKAKLDTGARNSSLTAVWRDRIVHEHPDTGNPVNGVQIPTWDTLLKIAAQCYEITGPGYIGVDIVLDRHRGPLILELNARPGLSIQIACRSGLLPRLRLVQQHCHNLAGISDRLKFSKEYFSPGKLT